MCVDVQCDVLAELTEVLSPRSLPLNVAVRLCGAVSLPMTVVNLLNIRSIYYISFRAAFLCFVVSVLPAVITFTRIVVIH